MPVSGDKGWFLEGRVGVRRGTEVMATFLSSCRLTLNKSRLLIQAAKGFMSKSPSRVSEASSEGDNENIDYLPLVSSSFPGLAGVAWSLQGSRGQEDPPGSCLLLSLMATSKGLLRDGELLHPCVPFS